MAKSHVESLLQKLPHSPGVYKMKDEEGRILYVGKAKDLSKRVRSYFRVQKDRNPRTEKLVEQIADLEWIEVGSDLEAIFLETNLIKELRPKYNVLMKDDKNFVYVKITKKEDFPRIEIVRRVEKDGSRYFGPKTAAHSVRKLLMLLQKLFMYRSCDLGIDWEDGAAQVTRKTIAYPCLDYHIKRCAAPCIGKITPEEYAVSIARIEAFLEGKTEDIEVGLKAQIATCVEKKEFERAALLRDKLLALQDIARPRQVVTAPDQEQADVFGFVLEAGKAYINLFMLREGKLINQENFIVDAFGYEAGQEEQAADVMESFLTQYYQKATDFPRHVLISTDLEEKDFMEDWLCNQAGRRIELRVPERGKKHQLLELAEKNARSFQKQHKARWEGFEEKDEEALEELGRALGLPKAPKRMECYDISHLGGTDTVASMVVFEHGKSKSSDYRKFHLKTIAEGEIDDFKSMQEILLRRLSYLTKAPKGLAFRSALRSHSAALEALWQEWRGTEEPFDGELKEYTVALKGKTLVGFVRLTAGEDAATKDTFLQRALYVTPELRGQGIAKALLRWAYDHKKAKRVYLSCPEERRSFYEDFGFESVKQLPESHLIQLSPEDLNVCILAYDPSKHHDASFKSKPDLIVIDGGKGQLSHAMASRDELGLSIPMIGLAKREEEVFFPDKPFPLLLPRDSKALHLLQRIRDEAHRFAITFQRGNRKKHLTASSLDPIQGLGDVGKMKLLQHFGSVERIKAASEEEVAAVVGEKMAQKILETLL